MVQEYMFESFDGTELYGKTDSKPIRWPIRVA